MSRLLALALLIVAVFSITTHAAPARAQGPTPTYYLGEEQAQFSGLKTTYTLGVSSIDADFAPAIVESDDPVVGFIVYYPGAVPGYRTWWYEADLDGHATNHFGLLGSRCYLNFNTPGFGTSPQCNFLFPFVTTYTNGGTTLRVAGSEGEEIDFAYEFQPGIGSAQLGTVNARVRLIYYGVHDDAEAAFEFEPASGYAPLTVAFSDISNPVDDICEWFWDFGDSHTSIEQNPIHIYADAANYTVTLTIETCSTSDTDSISHVVEVDNLGELVKPLALEERDGNFGAGETAGFKDYSEVFKNSLDNYITDFVFHNAIPVGPHAVQAISTFWGAKVMAVSAGTVTSVTRINPNGCANGSVFQGEIQFTPRDVCAIELFENSELDEGGGSDELFIDYVWVVTVQDVIDSDVEYTYLVANAYKYIQAGDIVDAGCIIGETIPFKETIDVVTRGAPQVDLTIGGAGVSDVLAIFDLDYPDAGFRGVAIVAAYQGDKNLELLSALVEERNPNDACNHNELFRTCKNADPGLERESNWSSVNQADWQPGGGVILGPAGSITSAIPMNLDPAEQYSFSVIVLPEPAYFPRIGQLSGPHMRLRLGQTSEDFDLGTIESFGNEAHTFRIEQALHDPDLGGSLYTIAIENIGSSNLRVVSACVAENADGLEPVGSCYFQDPLFQFGGTGFTIPSGVEVGTGAVFLNNGETISTTVTLYAPDTDPILSGDYYLTAEFDLWYSGDIAERSGEVWISYEFPDGEGFEQFQQIDVAPGPDGPELQPLYFALNSSKSVTTLITVSEDTTGTLTIRADVDTEDSSLYGIRLTKLCLTGTWPGGSVDGYFPGIPFTETCSENPMPQDQSNVGLWIAWHWSNLNSFFQCDLMRALNMMYRTMLDTFKLFGYSVRYAIAQQDVLSRWMGTQLFPYLNGHFRNIAIGTVTTITDGSANLFDVLLALINSVLSPLTNLIVGVIGQAATLLFTIIVSLLTLLLSAFAQLMTLFGTGRLFIEALALAWNSSTPTAIPYLPTCADPQANGFCILMWFAENTIFSPLGPGVLIIPVVIGIFSVHMLIDGIQTFRKLMLDIGSST